MLLFEINILAWAVREAFCLALIMTNSHCSRDRPNHANLLDYLPKHTIGAPPRLTSPTGASSPSLLPVKYSVSLFKKI